MPALSHDAGPTPATGADGALAVRLAGESSAPGADPGGGYRVIVHY